MDVCGNVLSRRAVRLVAWFVMLAVVAGCTDADDDADAAAETVSTLPAPETLLRVGAEDWPECLNPLTCDSPALRQQVLQHVLPVVFEVDAANRYQPSPLLAGEPEVALDTDAGTMTATYRIDTEARWIDGQPITSSDIRATWQAILATPEADITGYDRITQIDDTDPLVAVASFTAPYGDWKQLFGGGRGWVFQADALDGELDLTGRFRNQLPMSAGPFRLAAWDATSAVLATNQDYWEPDRRPLIDQVRFERIDLDELEDPRIYDVVLPAGNQEPTPDGFDVRPVPTGGIIGVWFDRRTALLQPLGHRQSLAAAIDRSDLVDLFGSDVVGDDPAPVECLGWLPDVGPWCEEAETELPGSDLDLAAFGLAVEGWSRDPSGTQVRGAEVFAIPLTHDPSIPGAEDVADEIESALDELGVRVERGEVPTRDWLEDRAPQSSVGLGVFSFPLGISPQVPDLYGCLAGPPSSVIGWCDPEPVALTRELVVTADADRQVELVGRIGSLAGTDVAWLPLAPRHRSAFVRTDTVSIPGPASITGGALTDLPAFEMTG